MRRHLSRRIAAVSLVSTLSFTLVACPSSDDQDTVENESESPENQSPDNESPENESPENESPENETGN